MSTSKRKAVLSIAIVALLLTLSGTAAARHIQQAITVDGNPNDWDSAWIVATDPTNDCCSSQAMACGATCPHDSNCCARSGYDLTSLSAHWYNNTWYFLMRTDGLPGDSDSVAGTCPSPLGYGTTGNDGGLLQGTFSDQNGIGNAEQYGILIDNGVDQLVAQLTSCLNPGAPGCSISGDVNGTAAFGSVAPDGAVEFGVPEVNIFPLGVCRNKLQITPNCGSNRDRLAEEEFSPATTLILQFSLDKSHQPDNPQVGQNVTYYFDYSITGSSGVPATGTTIEDTLDTELTYQSCTAPSGGSCSYDSDTRKFTCTLPTSIAPGSAQATGQCTMVARVDSTGAVANTVEMRSNEGLCASDSDSFTPTAVKLTSFTATGLPGQVLVAWETATEVDNLGFNLYRRPAGAPDYILQNETLIPSEGPGQVEGAQYTFVDRDVTAGITYEYLLEDIDLSGVRTPHGPIATTVPWSIFLPLVFR